MAGLSFLEREIEKTNDQRIERPAMSAAELEHANRITENYRSIIFSKEMTGEAVEERRPSNVQKEEEIVIPSAAQRVADYIPAPAAPATKHRLFENLTYKDGVLYREGEETTASAPALAPAPAPVYAPAPAPVAEPVDEEDALPSRRTMETLHARATTMVEDAANTNTGFWAALSPKVKAAIVAVVACVVVILALVFANVAILNSLDASVADKQEQLAGLIEKSEEISEEIASIIDIENIDAWAAENGMFRS